MAIILRMLSFWVIVSILGVFSPSGVFAVPFVALDIGKQSNYRAGGVDIAVQKHERDGQIFYKHTPGEPSVLSEITMNGQYLHSETLSDSNGEITSSLVHWKNGRPEAVTLDCMRITLFLWNNRSGRLVHQASTIREDYGIQTANILDRQVTIDVDKRSDSRLGTLYMATNKSMKFYTLTDPELPGYQICRHTGAPFMVASVVSGTTPTGIKVTPEVHNVYVYKWNNVPLLADFELFNGKRLSFAYLDATWKAVKTPPNDNYKRMHYIREFLGYLNCRLGNRVTIDISKRAAKNNKPITYTGEQCTLANLQTGNSGSVSVELVLHTYGDLKGYHEHRHTLTKKTPLDIKGFINGNHAVVIELPDGPIRTVSCFVKSKNVVAFIEIVTGGGTCVYYKEVGNNTFVKYAVSDKPLRGTKDITQYTAGKVYVWKRGWLTNR